MQSAVRTATIRRKVFIAYHHADEEAVTRFMKRFGERNKVFITRALGEEMPGDWTCPASVDTFSSRSSLFS